MAGGEPGVHLGLQMEELRLISSQKEAMVSRSVGVRWPILQIPQKYSRIIQIYQPINGLQEHGEILRIKKQRI